MTILGFNFTKITAEREAPIDGKIDIKNDVTITDIEETEIKFGGDKQKCLKFSFKYTSIYEPKKGKIILEGDLIHFDEASKMDETMKLWKKSKKVSNDVIAPVLNTVLTRSNIQSLILSREINLPPSVRLPKVEIKTKN